MLWQATYSFQINIERLVEFRFWEINRWCCWVPIPGYIGGKIDSAKLLDGQVEKSLHRLFVAHVELRDHHIGIGMLLLDDFACPL